MLSALALLLAKAWPHCLSQPLCCAFPSAPACLQKPSALTRTSLPSADTMLSNKKPRGSLSMIQILSFSDTLTDWLHPEMVRKCSTKIGWGSNWLRSTGARVHTRCAHLSQAPTHLQSKKNLAANWQRKRQRPNSQPKTPGNARMLPSIVLGRSVTCVLLVTHPSMNQWNSDRQS